MAEERFVSIHSFLTFSVLVLTSYSIAACNQMLNGQCDLFQAHKKRRIFFCIALFPICAYLQPGHHSHCSTFTAIYDHVIRTHCRILIDSCNHAILPHHSQRCVSSRSFHVSLLLRKGPQAIMVAFLVPFFGGGPSSADAPTMHARTYVQHNGASPPPKKKKPVSTD